MADKKDAERYRLGRGGGIGLPQSLVLAGLAVVFTLGLTFVSAEGPRLVDSFLGNHFSFLDVSTIPEDHPDYDPDGIGACKTELYFKTYRLRWIGYGCLAAVTILIIVGFVTNRSGLSTAGAIALFLPVFGHFALTMFFLGGLGFLRLLWMPFLDVSFDVMRLGDIIVLPYKWLASLYSLAGLNSLIPLAALITGTGLFLFFFGTMTWFVTHLQKRDVADSWIYRFSRHPQYLGWIVWSYGILFLPGSEEIKKYFELSNALPWLLATMVIIGVALIEELKMSRLYGNAFDVYRERTPFMFPLPKLIRVLSLAPVRVLFGKRRPERKREVFVLLAVYAGLLMAGSAFYAGLIPLSLNPSTGSGRGRIEALVGTARENNSSGARRAAIGQLGRMGEPAVPYLMPFLNDPDPVLRWNAATALGDTRSERAVDPLIKALFDENWTVRGNTAAALGHIGSGKAVASLIEAFWDERRGLAAAAAGALGKIGDRSVIPELERAVDEMENVPFLQVGQALSKLGSDRAEECFRLGLHSDRYYVRSVCIYELGRLKAESSLPQVTAALEDENENVRRAAVLALMNIGSERSIDALEAMLDDEDFEVRMYAREALRRIRNR